MPNVLNGQNRFVRLAATFLPWIVELPVKIRDVVKQVYLTTHSNENKKQEIRISSIETDSLMVGWHSL